MAWDYGKNVLAAVAFGGVAVKCAERVANTDSDIVFGVGGVAALAVATYFGGRAGTALDDYTQDAFAELRND